MKTPIEVAIVIVGGLLVLTVVAMLAWRAVTREPCSGPVADRHYVDINKPHSVATPTRFAGTRASIIDDQ